MPESCTLTLPDGRSVGFMDYGPATGAPVIGCHGGPGSRMEPAAMAAPAAAAGFRLVGIDRPGYGHSTPKPGRSIADWVPDGLAVADALGIDRFTAVGCSTGGAYALALAARAPERVRAVIACCALTDMRWREGKAMMTAPATARLWSAADREAAMAIDAVAVRCPVVVLHGESDNIVPAAHARHTAEIVPGAKLRIVPELRSLQHRGRGAADATGAR